ncbi:stage II sporulation protein D [Paenibacillus pini JCM 16418]|uniref:Stage II sporulation protein D n=2 Tax=Paenibacillus TaxID=44249 RepID=W7YHY9_9BACL|nr:stage II sporulation protein D [Paenibacillus pini JCM 16418]
MWAGGLLALALLLPVLVVATHHHQPPEAPAVPKPAPPPIAAPNKVAQPPQVSVYLSKTGQVETLPLEDYVTGVIAAEMPASFELEALKAQAIAARTFIARRLVDNDKSGVPEASAMVTDTVRHQAYISKASLENWKAKGKSAQLAKLKRAVLETKNIILTYKGKPITASFFSTSNGYTENSEDYWNVKVPYLRSVASPWDQKIAPGFKKSVTISRTSLLKKLGLNDQSMPTLATGKSFIQVLSSTVGHRIDQVSVGGTIFTGREIREKLGLRSSEFSWEAKGDDIILTTYGYGHGVGMSQWGADGMAKEGYTATQILKHYYTGIEFQQASKLLKK